MPCSVTSRYTPRFRPATWPEHAASTRRRSVSRPPRSRPAVSIYHAATPGSCSSRRRTPGRTRPRRAAFEVTDLPAAVAELKGRGVKFEEYDMPGLQDRGRSRPDSGRPVGVVQGHRRQRHRPGRAGRSDAVERDRLRPGPRAARHRPRRPGHPASPPRPAPRERSRRPRWPPGRPRRRRREAGSPPARRA